MGGLVVLESVAMAVILCLKRALFPTYLYNKSQERGRGRTRYYPSLVVHKNTLRNVSTWLYFSLIPDSSLGNKACI
jgi:hypothetical protein